MVKPGHLLLFGQLRLRPERWSTTFSPSAHRK